MWDISAGMISKVGTCAKSTGESKSGGFCPSEGHMTKLWNRVNQYSPLVRYASRGKKCTNNTHVALGKRPKRTSLNNDNIEWDQVYDVLVCSNHGVKWNHLRMKSHQLWHGLKLDAQSPWPVIATWWPSGRLGMSALSPRRRVRGISNESLRKHVMRLLHCSFDSLFGRKLLRQVLKRAHLVCV